MNVRTLSIFNNQYITLSKDKSESRMAYLDLIAGVMIINMILVHLDCLTEIGFGIITKYFSFFMPWFFFKAGMFAKNEPMTLCAIKSFKRLIIPFLIYGIIGEIIYRLPLLSSLNDNYLSTTWRIAFNAFKSVLLTGTFVGNLSLWYLTSLFIIKVLFAASINRNSYYFIGLICLIAPLLHFMPFDAPIYIANISSGMFFYAIGYFCRNIRINNLYLSILLLATCIFIACVCPNGVDMKNNTLITGNYLMWYISSLIGIFGFTSFIRLANVKISVLEKIGRDSLGYFSMHAFIITSMGFVFPGNQSHCIECTVVAVVLMMTILPLLVWICKKLPVKYLI